MALSLAQLTANILARIRNKTAPGSITLTEVSDTLQEIAELADSARVVPVISIELLEAGPVAGGVTPYLFNTAQLQARLNPLFANYLNSAGYVAGGTPVPAPTVTGFTPASGTAGTTLITVTGTNFTGVTGVKLNSVAVTAFTVVSATSITFTLPAAATTGTIAVSTASGTGTSATSLTIGAAVAAPTIASFSPASGVSGTTVTITGTNLTGASAVTLNNVSVGAFTVVSATSITFITTAASATGTLAVTTAGGTATSASAFTFTPSASAPTITSFAPASAAVGATVTVTGTNFTGSTLVKVGTVTAATFTVVSATSLTFAIPVGAVTGSIAITSPSGTATSAGSLTIPVAAAPALTDLSIDASLVSAGGSLTRTGATLTLTGAAVSSNAVWQALRAPANASFALQAEVTPGASAAVLSGQLYLDTVGTATPGSTTAKFGIFMAANGLRTIQAGATAFNNVGQTTANRMQLRGDIDSADSIHKIFFEYSNDAGATWVLITKAASGGVDMFLKVILANTNNPLLTNVRYRGLIA